MEVTYKDVTLPSEAWARLCGVTDSTMRWRIHHWGVERAVTSRGRQRKRSGYRRGVPLSHKEKDTILRLYNEGFSEDAIGGAISRSRHFVSRFLILCGLKLPGRSRQRVPKGAIKVKGRKATVERNLFDVNC